MEEEGAGAARATVLPTIKGYTRWSACECIDQPSVIQCEVGQPTEQSVTASGGAPLSSLCPVVIEAKLFQCNDFGSVQQQPSVPASTLVEQRSGPSLEFQLRAPKRDDARLSIGSHDASLKEQECACAKTQPSVSEWHTDVRPCNPSRPIKQHQSPKRDSPCGGTEMCAESISIATVGVKSATVVASSPTVVKEALVVFSQLQIVEAESALARAAAGAREAAGTAPSQLQTSVNRAATDVLTVVAGGGSASEAARVLETCASQPSAKTQASPSVSECARTSTDEYVDLPTGSRATVDTPTEKPLVRPDEPP